MNQKLILLSLVPMLVVATSLDGEFASAKATIVDFKQSPGLLEIIVDDKPVAVYVYEDEQIPRPYFANLRALNGTPVTRNQPPIAGEDLVDHPTFHPGLWLAFGDLNGADNWRLVASVKHVEFIQSPAGGAFAGSFAVRNRYFDQRSPAEPICDETCRYEIHAHTDGLRIIWDSTFSSDREFSFGDQEEMGLGLRIATPLRAQRQAEGDVPGGNGEIRDAVGRRNEKEVWGNAADWCDYSGTVDGLRVGMTIFCHPQNFRPSWFHARDRGLLVANPFGRAAFHKGEPSRVVVKPGESLRLRYGVLVYASPENDPLDLAAEYRDYGRLTSEN